MPGVRTRGVEGTRLQARRYLGASRRSTEATTTSLTTLVELSRATILYILIGLVGIKDFLRLAIHSHAVGVRERGGDVIRERWPCLTHDNLQPLEFGVV